MNRPHTPPRDLSDAVDAARGWCPSEAFERVSARRAAQTRAARLRVAGRILRVAALVAAAVAAGLVLTAPRAEPQTWPNRMSLAPGDFECFAVVRIENRAGVYNAVETLPTQHGPVSIRYKTVGGHNPTDHDLIEVVDLPDGVAAVPMEMAIPDGDVGTVCLMKYLGG